MLLKLLKQYLRPYRKVIAAVVIFQAIQTVANLYLPRLNAAIIDQGVTRGDNGVIWSKGFEMLGLSMVQIAGTCCALYAGSRIAAGFGRDLRAAIFSRIQSFSARELGSFGAPTLITRNTNDVQQVQTVVLMGCNMLVSAPITIAAGAYMALSEDTQLSWLLVVCIPAMVGSLGFIITRLVPQFRRMQDRIDNVNRILREQLAGMRVVRAFVQEQREAGRFDKANSDITDTAMSVGRLTSLMFPTVMLVFNVSSVAVLWFGANRVEAGHLQVGALIAFITYLMQILMTVMFATFMSTMVPRAAVCADRIGQVLTTVTSVLPPASPTTEFATSGTVEFRGATFQYPGAENAVLHNVSFTVSPGSTTAIVGSTGAGKTTLTHLIPRLYDTTSGSVLVNGVDVREIDPTALAKFIGLVPQQPYMFAGTIATNLRYGKPDATDEELWEALQVAQAEDFVRDMPDGLDTNISQGGTTVSGGQRQRLAIARALVHRPQIYLFDDSFSALDMATDARLRAALRPRTREAAVLIVAQRVSTIRSADQIVVLDNGAVVGIGGHDQLLDSCPTYLEIVESQQAAEEAA